MSTQMIQNPLQSLGQLLRGWWKVDRIRICATTGLLFQLVPGDRLLIGEHLLVVRKRQLLQRPVETSGDESAALGVEYHLVELLENVDDGEDSHADKIVVGADNQWRLQILLPNDSPTSVHRLWIREAMEELLEEEIIVL